MSVTHSSTTTSGGVTPYTFSGGYGGMGCASLAESGTMQVGMSYEPLFLM